jgi:hypothetical protein
MKNTIIGFTLAFVVAFVFYALDGNAQMGSGTMGRGGMMGQGEMMGQGSTMGPGTDSGTQQQQPQQPLEEKDIKPMIENYLKSTRNPNLKLGKIVDKGSAFEAEIVTKDNSLVDRIAVDKTTGSMRSVY